MAMKRRRRLTPKDVVSEIKAHDKRMDSKKLEFEEIKALWKSAWWSWIRGTASTGEKTWTGSRWSVRHDIEVNRMWPFLHGYQHQLYPRPGVPVVTPDPTGRGDAEACRAALKYFLSRRSTHLRSLMGIRQALMYDGVAIKMGYQTGTASAMHRVFTRVIPWWELVRDEDVSDPADQRFIGHAFYKPRTDVEEEFGLKNLKGRRRTPFLGSDDGGPALQGPQRAQRGREQSKQGAGFVRVLEWVNLVDTYVDENGLEYKGRFEIYVLDQSEIEREDGSTIPKGQPISSTPIPFDDVNGEPKAHIIPLIFNPDPEKPLQGVPQATRIRSQCVELNLLRTIASSSAKKDARIYVSRAGMVNAEQKTLLAEGVDGTVIDIEDDERALDDVLRPLQHGNVSLNIHDASRAAEGDLDRAAGQSPNARGVITKSTAWEAQNVQRYTESDFGYHANRRDDWLEEVCQLYLRVLIAAMQDTGDYTGAYEQDDVNLFPIGADRVVDIEDPAELAELEELADAAGDSYSLDTGEQPEPDQGALELELQFAEMFGSIEPAIDSEEAPALGQVADDEFVVEGLKIQEGKNEFIITPDALDAEFTIRFTEEGVTPTEEIDRKRDLMGVKDTVLELWSAVNPKAVPVVAEAILRTIHQTFRLDDALSVDNIFAKMKEMGIELEAPPEEPKPEVTDEEAAMASNGAEPTEPSPMDDLQRLREIAQQDPQQALAIIIDMMPDMAAELQTLARLPPEELSVRLLAIIDSMSQAAAGQGPM